MKLLFDEQLSHKLAIALADIFPLSDHVRNVGLANADDDMIWEFAKRGKYVLITKDEDFHLRSILAGHPPKVLWIRSGNCATDLVETLLRKNLGEILRFGNDPMCGFMPLY
ncbi:MAG: DUF5615 family PIN-like protein [Pirellulales bacterium]|nr:DUF5615 family PIN-like protein [Pirellulales bacterium]